MSLAGTVGLARYVQKRAASRRTMYLLGAALCVVFIVVCVWSLSAGAVAISFQEVLAVLAQQVSIPVHESEIIHVGIITSIRLPRTLTAVGIGCTLAVGGAVMQALFKNPLADPALIGVSSGAAVGTLFGIVMLPASWQASMYTLPVSAILGALCAAIAVYLASTHEGIISTTTMLLSGIAINAVSGAIVGLLTFVATDAQVRTFSFWTLGSVSGVTLEMAFVILASAIILFLVCFRLAPSLTLLAGGKAHADIVGVSSTFVIVVGIATVSLAVGISTAFCGVIGFVGLVVPNIVRWFTGDHTQRLLPFCAIIGATLVVAADVISRTIALPREIPLGVITAFIGTPFFIYVIRSYAKRTS